MANLHLLVPLQRLQILLGNPLGLAVLDLVLPLNQLVLDLVLSSSNLNLHLELHQVLEAVDLELPLVHSVNQQRQHPSGLLHRVLLLLDKPPQLPLDKAQEEPSEPLLLLLPLVQQHQRLDNQLPLLEDCLAVPHQVLLHLSVLEGLPQRQALVLPVQALAVQDLGCNKHKGQGVFSLNPCKRRIHRVAVHCNRCPLQQCNNTLQNLLRSSDLKTIR